MFFKFDESAKADEYIKSMPKKVPTHSLGEEKENEYYRKWKGLSNSEKIEVLNHFKSKSSTIPTSVGNSEDPKKISYTDRMPYLNQNDIDKIRLRESKSVLGDIINEFTR